MRGTRLLTFALVCSGLVVLAVFLLSHSLAPSLAQAEPADMVAAAPESKHQPTAWSSGWVTVTAGTCQELSHKMG